MQPEYITHYKTHKLNTGSVIMSQDIAEAVQLISASFEHSHSVVNIVTH